MQYRSYRVFSCCLFAGILVFILLMTPAWSDNQRCEQKRLCAVISGTTDVVSPGEVIELSGINSEGRPAFYAWRAPGFSPNHADEDKMSFRAPRQAGEYRVTLTVFNDWKNIEDTTTIKVIVRESSHH